MKKYYRVSARYYKPKTECFTDNYEYCIEANETIKDGDYIAVMEPDGSVEVRCILISNVKRLSKEDKPSDIKCKLLIGIVKTTFFNEMALRKRKAELLEQLEQRAAQASKMQVYETLASTDPEIASLLKELKEIS